MNKDVQKETWAAYLEHIHSRFQVGDTYHFSRWMGSERNGAHGGLLLEMRKALGS